MSKTRNRPSEQSSQTQQSDLLRSLTVPKYIALDYLKTPTTAQVKRNQEQVVQWALKNKIIAYRPQQRPLTVFKQVPRREMYPGYNQLWQKPQEVVKKTLCKRRSDRRESLFSLGVAGAGRRRSPGQGGSYKRTRESRISC